MNLIYESNLSWLHFPKIQLSESQACMNIQLLLLATPTRSCVHKQGGYHFSPENQKKWQRVDIK